MISMLDSDKEKKSSVDQSRHANERLSGGNGNPVSIK